MTPSKKKISIVLAAAVLLISLEYLLVHSESHGFKWYEVKGMFFLLGFLSGAGLWFTSQLLARCGLQTRVAHHD